MFCLMAAGCSASEEGGACVETGSVYVISSTERSGDCGDLEITTTVVNTGSGLYLDPGNSLSPGYSPCTEEQSGCTFSGSCRGTGEGCTLDQVFSTTFEGSTASGVLTIMVSCDDGSSCSSTYDVHAQRQ